MPDLKDVMLQQTKLIVIPIKVLERYNRNGVKATFQCCNNSECIAWNEDQVVFPSILCQYKQVFNVFIVVFQIYVLLLMDDELEVNLDLRQVLDSPLELTLVGFVLLKLLQIFFNGLVQYLFYVVNDIFYYFVIQIRKYNDLEKWLESSQYFISVWPNLEYLQVTNTITCTS